jgi:hypothetical protein
MALRKALTNRLNCNDSKSFRSQQSFGDEGNVQNIAYEKGTLFLKRTDSAVLKYFSERRDVYHILRGAIAG